MTEFVAGFIGLLTAAGDPFAVPPVEITGNSYSRQPVRFSNVVNGTAKLANRFSFGRIGATTSVPIAGRAVYASRTATVPLLVLPFSSPRLIPGADAADQASEGDIVLSVFAMADCPDGTAFFGGLTTAPAHAAGTVYDQVDLAAAKFANQPNAPLFSTASAASVLMPAQATFYVGSSAFTIAAGQLSPAGVAGAI